eukprot:scaffold11521_cov68-Phaeocystis_antarctica.AAC.13
MREADLQLAVGLGHTRQPHEAHLVGLRVRPHEAYGVKRDLGYSRVVRVPLIVVYLVHVEARARVGHDVEEEGLLWRVGVGLAAHQGLDQLRVQRYLQPGRQVDALQQPVEQPA